MPAVASLALGTVQFGLDYGVTNRAGRVAASEIDAILALAADSGIDTLDTAALYGDAEEVLGAGLARVGSSFRIISKTAKRLEVASPGEAADRLRRDLEVSLERLRV